jgi:hypothetical protein
MPSIMRWTRIPKLGRRRELLCAGGAGVKMFSASPTALHSDQTHDAGHFFNRRHGPLSNRISRSGGSKHHTSNKNLSTSFSTFVLHFVHFVFARAGDFKRSFFEDHNPFLES